MNETFTLPRLAEVAAARSATDIASAEKFATVFFAHVADALAVSESVEIDGLGIFSRSDNPDEPIVFTPSQSLADALNQPFEMFEPVAIGTAEIDASDVIVPDAAESSLSQVGTSLSAHEAQEQQHIVPPISVPETSPEEQAAPNASLPPAITDSDISFTTVTNVVPGIVPDVETPAEAPRRSGSLWFIALFLLGLIIGLATGYFGHDRIRLILHHSDSISESFINQTSDTGDEASDTTPADLNVTDGAKTTDTTLNDSIASEINSEEEVETSDESASSSEPVYDTVTPQRFLTTMAREYYGPMEYWVFIYEANSDILGNPNRIRPGTRVVIPDITDLTRGETPEQTLKRAKFMGHEIYDRFKQRHHPSDYHKKS